MDKFEIVFLTTENLKPLIWLRYIDDIFFVWTHGEENLDDFLRCLNVFHPNLKFTCKYSTDRINFLDIIVKKEKDGFVTDLYCKATHCDHFCHYDSCHPDHIKKSNIYSNGTWNKMFMF